MKRFSYFLLMLVVLWAIPANAAWFGLTESTSAPADVRIVAADTYGLTLAVDVPGLEVTEDQDDYVTLTIPEAGFAGAIGEPRLPVINRLIRVPFGADVRVETTADFDELPVTELTGAARLMPVQPAIPKIPGARENAVFTVNEKAYRIDAAVFAAPAAMTDEGALRGYRFMALQVRPVNYNPVTGILQVAKSMRVAVRFLHPDYAETEYQGERYAEPRTYAMAKNLLINFDQLETTKAAAFTPTSYVIIGTPAVLALDKVQELIEWKAQRGYDVVPVTVAEAGNQPANIMNYLRDAYQNWDRPPAYVLLLGDINLVPQFIGATGYSLATDLYYGTMNKGDYFPDLGVGRLSFANQAQLTNEINKILDYEKNLWDAGDNWTRHATFMASTDNSNISEGTHNYVCNSILIPAGFTCTKIYSADGATTQQALTAINSGPTIHAYSGHGSETSWADGPPVSQAQVRNLTNTTTPLVLSHACLTGSYQIGECFAETWVRIPTGALAFWGASDSTYWTEDDIIERAMFTGWFAGDGTLAALPWTRGMLDFSMVKLYEAEGAVQLVRHYFEMYNLFGDPEVMLYSAAPADVTPDYAAEVPLGTNSIQVSVPGHPGAMVGLSADGEFCGVGYADASGNAVVEVVNQPKNAEATLTVTGQNMAPFVGTIAFVADVDDDDDSADDDAADDDAADDDAADDDAADDDAADDDSGDDDNDDNDSGGCS
ncbi:MAG: hypothetical protein GX444_04265 [Myxococcales bacterium]|nr:hypothetical protein [Myxococcales bacterium]